jgi:hypothetical protein
MYRCENTIASSPGRTTLKTWEWPGDVAKNTILFAGHGK